MDLGNMLFISDGLQELSQVCQRCKKNGNSPWMLQNNNTIGLVI